MSERQSQISHFKMFGVTQGDEIDSGGMTVSVGGGREGGKDERSEGGKERMKEAEE